MHHSAAAVSISAAVLLHPRLASVAFLPNETLAAEQTGSFCRKSRRCCLREAPATRSDGGGHSDAFAHDPFKRVPAQPPQRVVWGHMSPPFRHKDEENDERFDEWRRATQAEFERLSGLS